MQTLLTAKLTHKEHGKLVRLRIGGTEEFEVDSVRNYRDALRAHAILNHCLVRIARRNDAQVGELWFPQESGKYLLRPTELVPDLVPELRQEFVRLQGSPYCRPVWLHLDQHFLAPAGSSER